MGKYLTTGAIKWALDELKRLPKNQTALFYFLIFAKAPKVDRTNEVGRNDFEEEFYTYFGAPIKGGGTCVYDPFGGEWRASEYINSTVYGRLLVGSHKWTEGEESFFMRNPAGSGWPATFSITDKGLDNLMVRSSPPCLAYDYRLPLSAVSVYYYRFKDLGDINPKNLEDVVGQYKKEVLEGDRRLFSLFVNGSRYPGELFRSNPLSEDEKLSCYPVSPFTAEPKSRELLYKSDIENINSRLAEGETIADYIHRLLSER